MAQFGIGWRSYELSEKTQHGLACPSSSSCCGLPFSIVREINLWLRFISRRKAELMRFSWYTAQHTHQVKEKKMKNWNDKVALLACCQSNWSDLCAAEVWWIEIKYVRIYLDHTSEERATKYIRSLFMGRGNLSIFFWQWYWSKTKIKPIQNQLRKWSHL